MMNALQKLIHYKAEVVGLKAWSLGCDCDMCIAAFDKLLNDIGDSQKDKNDKEAKNSS